MDRGIFATSYKPLAIRSYPNEIRFTRNTSCAITRRTVMNHAGERLEGLEKHRSRVLRIPLPQKLRLTLLLGHPTG